MPPALVAFLVLDGCGKRSPAGSCRCAQWKHPRLRRHLVGLAGVADDAGRHQIVPAALASLVPWNHVIQIELLGVEYHSAILTGKLVALENILPRELHLLFR